MEPVPEEVVEPVVLKLSFKSEFLSQRSEKTGLGIFAAIASQELNGVFRTSSAGQVIVGLLFSKTVKKNVQES